MLRTVVPTNNVHIVQRRKQTVSYGAGQSDGNVYWKWPAFIPVIGNAVTELPLSVFKETIDDYPGYDKGRVPFLVDVIAFFRISDPNTAAARVPDFGALREQLQGIMKGALRSILASSDIEEILESRSKFGEMFTHEVDSQLKEWGVTSVKSIELMDIRDQKESSVIQNIMAKKKSLIEMESRIAVAKNLQAAKVAEVESAQAVAVRTQEQTEMIGRRTAQADQNVRIAQQQAEQAVQTETAITAQKAMEVNQVNAVRQAEISRLSQVIDADRQKQVRIVNAEAEKSATITLAEAAQQKSVIEAKGTSDGQKLIAEGIQAQGLAKAEAEKAMQLAPVTAQISLAKEIGENKEYQEYLITIRKVEAMQAIGVQQAEALKGAEVKIIANAGDAGSGLDSVRDIFTAKGGLSLGAMFEAFKNTDAGQQVMTSLGMKTPPTGSNGAAH